MLKIIGLWPEESKVQREELLSRLLLLLNVVTLIFATIPSLMSLIKERGDMIMMIDNLQYTLPFFIVTLKVFIMWNKKRALSLLIDMIVKDWIRVKLQEERIIMLKQAKISRLLATCGALMIFFTIVITLLTTDSLLFQRTIRSDTNLTDFQKSLPIKSYYLYDVYSSPKYELTYLAQVIALFFSGLTYTAVDNFLGLLILHVCSQMKNLNLRLLNLEKNPNFETFLKYNVEDHIRLIRSIEIINNTFKWILLGLLFLYGILFCLHGFLILNVANQNGHLSITKLSWYISVSVSTLVHMCLYCAVGELLVTQSEKIHHAAYEYIWYTLEPKVAKNLILIMLYSKKPLNITAGKVFPMTMSTFCNLLKTSAGYVSVLLANRD